MEEAKAFYLKDVANITYVNSNYEALVIAGALILLTEWKELHSPVMMK